jgi:hypothetical protein
MTQPIAPLASELPAGDRLRGNVERLFAAMLPMLAYMVRWEYLVVAATPSTPGIPATVDGVPVDPVRCPCGPLTGIAIWKGPSGSPCLPTVGSRVLVEFHDASPAKPAVCALDPSVPIVPPLSIATALTVFATTLGAADPPASPACTALITALEGLL